MREGRLDVVVAGGSNGAYLRQHVDVPVVLVKVTGFDVMSALATARRISPKVALVTHASTYAEVDEFVRAFSLAVPAYTYLTEDDAVARVKALKQEGIQVVVGPGLVTDLADRYGLTGVFLYSGNSVRMALEDAICLAVCADESNSDFAAAFRRYQDIRIVRTARVQISSLMMDKLNHAKGVERLVRNSLFDGRTAEEYYDRLAWLYTPPPYVR